MTPIAQTSTGLPWPAKRPISALRSRWVKERTLFENLRRHVPRRSANFGEHVELLLFHHTTEAKVCYHDIRFFGFGAEEQVFRFQICIER